MKVARFESPFNIKIRQCKTPTIGDNDLLINVAYCGICGTDIHIYEGQLPFVTFPIVPGHEFSGTIKAMGAKVSNFAIGEKVTVNPNLS
ncbi:MAG: alcohol dehydrogenase catalytic domain-containing protein, partial [Promethearchaeota archaeon]